MTSGPFSCYHCGRGTSTYVEVDDFFFRPLCDDHSKIAELEDEIERLNDLLELKSLEKDEWRDAFNQMKGMIFSALKKDGSHDN